MSSLHHKDSAINIRIQSQQRALLDKAAALQNKSRSEFILDTACKEAENLLLDRRLFIVNDEQYQEFTDILSEPLEDNEGLISLLKRKSPWEK